MLVSSAELPLIKVQRSLSLTDAVDVIKWSDDETFVACVVNGSHVGIYQQPEWSHVASAQPHFLPILAIAWSPAGRHLATASKDCTVRVCDARTGDIKSTQPAHLTPVTALIWSPYNNEIASGSFDGSIRVWDTRSTKVRLRLAGHRDRISALAWSKSRNEIASAGDDGLVRVWSAETGKLVHSIQVSADGATALALSPASGLIVAPSSDLSLKVLDPTTGRTLKALTGHVSQVTELLFSKGGTLLYSLALDGDLRVWDVRTWQTLAALRMPRSGCSQLTLFKEGTQAAALDEQRRNVIYWTVSPSSESKAIKQPQVVQYKTAKIALVGDQGVGKTGLGTRIAEGQFRASESTHGQQFWLIPQLGAVLPDNVQCEAILWDFAGQQDYRLIHSLFLDDVELALVLFDPTDTQDPLKGVEFWLTQLFPRPDVPRKILLVGARLDRGAPTITIEELDRYATLHGISGGYVGISAKTGEGIPELLERIKSQLDWNNMSAVVATPVYSTVRDLVVKRKKKSQAFGVITTVDRICAELQPVAPTADLRNQVTSALGHLAAHGYIHLLDAGAKNDLVLLKPDVLINLASSMVLEARRNQRGLGVLEEHTLLRGGYTFSELSGLTKGESSRLLESATSLFLRHNICFRETLGPETLLVFPALINLKRPILSSAASIEEDATYRVKGETENLYAALVVLLGYTNTFTRTNQWQNQAEYELRTGELCGFQQTVSHDGQVDYVLYYGTATPDRARRLFQGLFESFLHGRSIAIQKFGLVLCPSCRDRQDRGAVIRRYLKGGASLHCANCGYSINLTGYTEIDAEQWTERRMTTFDRSLAHLRTEFETALVRVKAYLDPPQERPKRISVFMSYAWGDPDHERWVLRLAIDLRNCDFDVVFDQWHNTSVGASIAQFVERSASSDYVLIVGTPRYLEKYRTNETALYRGSILAAEVELINQRLTGTDGQKRTVLPVLLRDEPERSLPPLACGRVYADFRKEEAYFVELFGLIITMSQVGFDKPGILEIRESLKAAALKLETLGSGGTDHSLHVVG